MITPYKGFFEKAVPEQEREAYLADPMKLVAWVAENIRVDKDCNLGGSPITPEGCGRPVQPMRTAVISFCFHGTQHGYSCTYRRSDRKSAVDG